MVLYFFGIHFPPPDLYVAAHTHLVLHVKWFAVEQSLAAVHLSFIPEKLFKQVFTVSQNYMYASKLGFEKKRYKRPLSAASANSTCF